MKPEIIRYQPSNAALSEQQIYVPDAVRVLRASGFTVTHPEDAVDTLLGLRVELFNYVVVPYERTDWPAQLRHKCVVLVDKTSANRVGHTVIIPDQDLKRGTKLEVDSGIRAQAERVVRHAKDVTTGGTIEVGGVTFRLIRESVLNDLMREIRRLERKTA